MKRYLLVEHQSGGCDHTIECGTRVSEFDAEDMATAIEIVKAGAFDEDDGESVGAGMLDGDERARDEVTLYELSDTPDHEFDLDALVLERDAKQATPPVVTLTLLSEAEERAEYERLRAKYDPPKPPPFANSVGTSVPFHASAITWRR